MRTLDRTLVIVLSALVGAGVAMGCGDDKDGGGGDVSTGIAPETKLADVTMEQASSACQRLKVGFDRVFERTKLIRTVCTLVGAAVADTTADCAMIRDSCIDQASMAGSDTAMMLELDAVEFDCEGESELDQCTGTVGQLETCFNDTLDAVEGAFSEISCDDAATTDEDALEGFGATAFAEPASCEAVGCPEGTLFGSDTEETAP